MKEEITCDTIKKEHSNSYSLNTTVSGASMVKQLPEYNCQAIEDKVKLQSVINENELIKKELEDKVKLESVISENELVKKELEDKLIKQEEEKKLLLEKLKEMEEAHKILCEKLNENQNQLEEDTEEFSSMEMREGMTNQELKIELEQVKNALNKLENKNSLLEGQLAAANSRNTTESVADLMEAELTCTICSELFVTAVTLTCTHTFCKYCISQWKKKQKTCPICRKKITNETKSLVVDNYIDKMVESLSVELKERREAIIAERNVAVQCKKLKKSR